MNKMCEETRKEANKKVDKATREIQVLSILNIYPELTSKQVARYMAYRNYTKEIDYNNARPRLTSLLEKREVCIVGKALDKKTNCKEVVYQITKQGKDRLAKKYGSRKYKSLYDRLEGMEMKKVKGQFIGKIKVSNDSKYIHGTGLDEDIAENKRKTEMFKHDLEKVIKGENE